jgi:hypothetical protein
MHRCTVLAFHTTLQPNAARSDVYTNNPMLVCTCDIRVVDKGSIQNVVFWNGSTIVFDICFKTNIKRCVKFTFDIVVRYISYINFTARRNKHKTSTKKQRIYSIFRVKSDIPGAALAIRKTAAHTHTRANSDQTNNRKEKWMRIRIKNSKYQRYSEFQISAKKFQ